MSTARGSLASSRSFTRSAAQLVWGEGRTGSKTTPPWICQQCQSRLGTRRMFSGWSSHRKTELGDRQARRILTNQPKRLITDDVKSKERRNGENGPQTELPSQEEQRRSTITKRFSSVMDNLQANIFFAGQRLNDLTGYSGIEKLKKEIEEQERDLRAAQDQLTAAKGGYTSAIQQRSDSQREVNELLQRKNSWSPQDLERFTSLYRTEHAHEQAEIEAQQKLTDAERLSEEASRKLSSKILRRYHEEQIWSDKIRRMSTWGTWGLMGVNVLLFLVFQIGVEPWRRKRLVRGFEEKVIEALETQKQHANKVTGEALAALQATHIAATTEGSTVLSEAEELADKVVTEEVAAELGTFVEEAREAPSLRSLDAWLPGLRNWQDRLEFLFGEQEVSVRQVDLTKKLLEGAFVGVMLTSIIATMIRGR